MNESLINEQCAIVHNAKNDLNNTDYQVIRAYEGGETLSEEVKTARAAARVRINAAEAEILRLKSETTENISNQLS